jgi:addiction module RelE/StbE family toxin
MDIEPHEYTVQMMPDAERDINHIHNYIAVELDSPRAAAGIMLRIESAIMALRDFPKIGPACQSERLKAKNYRKLVIKNYIAFYLVDDITKTVLVMRVLYGRRNYEELL